VRSLRLYEMSVSLVSPIPKVVLYISGVSMDSVSVGHQQVSIILRHAKNQYLGYGYRNITKLNLIKNYLYAFTIHHEYYVVKYYGVEVSNVLIP
jgi:hypothetical protein